MLLEIGPVRLEAGMRDFDLEWRDRFCLRAGRHQGPRKRRSHMLPEVRAFHDARDAKRVWANATDGPGAWEGRLGPIAWEWFGPASYRDFHKRIAVRDA